MPSNAGHTLVLAVAITLSGCSVTPIPFTQEETRQRVKEDLSHLTANQEPVTGAISLHEAMARAVAYNLDFRVEILKKDLATRQLDLSRYDQLPSLVANISADGRDNYSGASSRSLLTGAESLESSTSSERNVTTRDLGLSWNVLDFGVSYYRAQQAADKVLITEEQKRKVINQILKDVRSKYWRAVSNDRLMRRIRNLKLKVEKQLEASRQVEKELLDTPLTALIYQRELIEQSRALDAIHNELKVAKIELAALMNLPMGQEYELVVTERPDTTPTLGYSPQFMELLALENRSELKEIAYEKRINSKQAKEAILSLLPGLELNFGNNYSSNSYLFNDDWLSYSARISWNLINIFKYPDTRKVIEGQSKVLDAQRLALSMAILTQVHLGIAQYKHTMKEYQHATNYHATQNRILRQVEAGVKAAAISEQTLIREELNTLVAEVRYDLAYANMESAYADSLAAIGVYPSLEELDTTSIKSLSKSLEIYFDSQKKYNKTISMQLSLQQSSKQ